MNRLSPVIVILSLLAVASAIHPAPASSDVKNRVAVAMDSRTFVTVKDDGEWEYVHLYKVEEGKLVLVDSVAVRQDHQIERIIEFRRMAIEAAKE